MMHSAMLLLVTAILVIAPSLSSAHQDTQFSLSPDGTLQNLPDKYHPGRVEIVHDGEFGPPIVTLTLSGNETRLPVCLAELFDIPKARIETRGSWYHVNSSLPPYLTVVLPQDTRKDGTFITYSLLFNLETAAFINSEFLSFNLADFCDPQEIKQLRVESGN